jgi:prepilin-type N-terminal cleavage/methylation domain-containing protein/prepilin-type processing-associated H-X9-DG protein
MSQRKSGFTLIELLVVVSIIALLLAILLPTLGHARDQAKQVVCCSNLRQIGIGLTGYMGEYNGRPPISYADNGTSYHDGWGGAWECIARQNLGIITDATQYQYNTTDAVRKVKIMRCPTLPPVPGGTAPLTYYCMANYTSDTGTSQGPTVINTGAAGDPGLAPTYPDSGPSVIKNVNLYPPITAFAKPSATILVYENPIYHEIFKGPGVGNLIVDQAGNYADKVQVHQTKGYLNFAFADGHAEFLQCSKTAKTIGFWPGNPPALVPGFGVMTGRMWALY